MKEKFIISIIFQFTSHLFYLIGSYFLALTLDVELMGIWALICSMVNFGFILADLGVDSIHYQYSGKSDFKDYFGTYFVIRILILLLNIIISIILMIIFQLLNTIYFQYLLILLIAKIIFTNIITLY